MAADGTDPPRPADAPLPAADAHRRPPDAAPQRDEGTPATDTYTTISPARHDSPPAAAVSDLAYYHPPAHTPDTPAARDEGHAIAPPHGLTWSQRFVVGAGAITVGLSGGFNAISEKVDYRPPAEIAQRDSAFTTPSDSSTTQQHSESPDQHTVHAPPEQKHHITEPDDLPDTLEAPTQRARDHFDRPQNTPKTSDQVRDRRPTPTGRGQSRGGR